MTPRLKHMIKYDGLDENLAIWIHSYLKGPTPEGQLLGKSMSNSLWNGFDHSGRVYMDDFNIKSRGFPINDPVLDIVDISLKEKERIQAMLASQDAEMSNLGLTIRNKYWDEYWDPKLKKALDGKNINTNRPREISHPFSGGED